MRLKHFLPRSFFGRALLIVALPTVLVQLVTAYIFYTRHWENVTRHMANALAGEIAFMSYQAARMRAEERDPLSWIFEETTGISAHFARGTKLIDESGLALQDFTEFRRVLDERIDLPFAIKRLRDEDDIQVEVQLSDGVVNFRMSVKRLESPTTSIFIFWMAGASAFFLLIALIFLRNQVRPVRELARAAESFGKGRDYPDFKPTGALELRRAARAFLVMRERINRQIRTRTQMLAGISHDLRTPLTRMKLQLALLGDTQETRDLNADVEQMQRMIEEYLDFARGSGTEESEAFSLNEAIGHLVKKYTRNGKQATFIAQQDCVLQARAGAFERMLQNLLDNALRYGTRAEVQVKHLTNAVEIMVDDNGPGIPADKRQDVFRPFTRLDEARNLNQGGVGLGLTIARDVARGHGGNITLSHSPLGGLRATVRMPL